MLTLQVIACIGIITGAFLLFHIRLNDFTGNIFHRLLDAPKGIREEILEETKRRKKSYFRREIEEVQEILKTTDREELFPLLCTASLLLFAAGAAIAVMIGNVFLIPVLACGFLFLPFWYIRLTASHFKKDVSSELETALSIITTAYLRSEDILTSVEENLDLFTRMKNGEFPDGAKVLRAKIDMAHPNMLFRDPIMYRIIHAEHHRTGDKWCIYPMYDYAHGQSDSIERITHSICTLEFDVHRPLYDWFIQALNIFPSHQYEFARLNLTYTMMSKRKLLKLVQEGAVMGWDDPRMPTICALRRKGYTPASVRNFAEMVGVAKRDNVIDLGKLEYCVREDLNRVAQRRMAVLNPLKVVITNYEEGKTELFTAINNPEDETAGTRQVPFSKVIWIERDDFMENPPKKFFRLSPGGEVRLRYSYLIKCEEVVKDEGGNITELRCTYDPMSGGGSSSDGRRVKGVIHWVSAADAVEAEIRLFNPLFTKEDPDDVAEGQTWEDNLNPESMVKITGYLEPSLRDIPVGQAVQFERVGYFCPDTDSTPGHLVFNRTVTLKDSWAKINK